MFDILWWKISLKSITKTSLIKFYGLLKNCSRVGTYSRGEAFSNGLFKDLLYCDHLYSLNNDNFIFLGSTDPQWSTMSKCPSVRPSVRVSVFNVIIFSNVTDMKKCNNKKLCIDKIRCKIFFFKNSFFRPAANFSAEFDVFGKIKTVEYMKIW